MVIQNNDWVSEETWKFFPHTFAETLSGGKWIAYKHLEYLSYLITETIVNGGGIIVVNMPPRHCKSYLTSLWLPAWYMDLFPDKHIILSSYESGVASEWGRKVRNLIQEKRQIEVEISDDSSARNMWTTKEGGGMITAGVGGAITSRGGNLLIVDDPIKNWQEAMSPTFSERCIDWFKSTFYTRAEPDATVIINMTRWSENDLTGWVTKNLENVIHICFPALAEENDILGRKIGEPLCPERYNLGSLSKIKNTVGTMIWNGLYQQRPTSLEGNMVKKHWWKFYDSRSELPKMDEIIQSWDLAFTDTKTGSFVCGQVWGRRQANKYLLDQFREHCDFPSTIKAIRDMTAKWDANSIYVEEAANGYAAIATLKNEISGIIPNRPEGSKIARLVAVTPQIESGNVYLPAIEIAPWVADYLYEFSIFPKSGAKNDQVDATSQALKRLGHSSTIQNLMFAPISMTKESAWR